MSEELNIDKRIYIGNVDYQTTEDDLIEFFKDLNVNNVEIPKKSYHKNDKLVEKSLGFAFVQFKDENDVSKSIEDFNKQELNGRIISIKKALPTLSPEEKNLKIIEKKKLKKDELKAKKLSKKIETDEAKTKTKPKAEPKVKQPLEEGTPSADTVFINNLPYTIGTKELNTLFKEYKPKWIHVPIRKLPNSVYLKQKQVGKPILNRGIAFVKLLNQQDQQKIIEEFDNYEIDGREIKLIVAIDSRIPKIDESALENSDNADNADNAESV